jgi:hypothetical protein
MKWAGLVALAALGATLWGSSLVAQTPGWCPDKAGKEVEVSNREHMHVPDVTPAANCVRVCVKAGESAEAILKSGNRPDDWVKGVDVGKVDPGKCSRPIRVADKKFLLMSNGGSKPISTCYVAFKC